MKTATFQLTKHIYFTIEIDDVGSGVGNYYSLSYPNGYGFRVYDFQFTTFNGKTYRLEWDNTDSSWNTTCDLFEMTYKTTATFTTK
jgi:hypothetical protein